MIFVPLYRKGFCSAFIALITAMTIWATIHAQEMTSEPPDERSLEAKKSSAGHLSLDELKSKRSEIEASTTLTDSAKKSALTFLDQAISFGEQLSQIQEEAADFVQKIKAAPERIAEIEKALKEPLPTPEEIESSADFSEMDTAKLKQQISQESAGLVEARSKHESLDDQVEKEKQRPQQIREKIVEAKQRLTDLQQELDGKALPDEPPLLSDARSMSLVNEQAKIQGEIKASEQYLAGHDFFRTWLSAERDLAERKIKTLESRLKVLKAKAEERRKAEALQARVATAEAKYDAGLLPDPVREEYDRNIALAKELQDLIREEGEQTKKLELLQTQLKELEEEFSLARSRVKVTISSDVVGLALREQRQNLPAFSSYRQDSARRQLKMSQIQAREIAVERDRREFADIDAEKERIMQALGPVTELERKSLEAQVETLLTDRLTLLGKLEKEYQSYFAMLETVEFTHQQLVTLADEFAEFLELNLMWIRTSRVLGGKDLGNVPSQIAWLISPGRWRQVLEDLRHSLGQSPVVWIFGVLLGGALVVGRFRMRRDLAETAKRVGQVQRDSLWLTIRALLATLGIAAGWPILMGLVGLQLSVLPEVHEFTMGISTGIMSAALTLLVYGLFYYICSDQGLAQVHFRWPEAVRRTLRQNLLWLIGLLTPLVFLFYAGSTVEYGDSVGRLAFMAAAAGVALFTGRILKPSGAIVSVLSQYRPNGWLIRTRWIWSVLAVGLPLAMGIMAALGYFFYTALKLANHVVGTYELVFFLVVAYHLLVRWLLVAKERLIWMEEKAKLERERDVAPEGKADAETGGEVHEGKAIAVEKKDIGLEEIDEQTHALLRVFVAFSALIGLWVIWGETLPAFRSITNIPLWSYSAEVDGVTKTFPITLNSVLFAGVVVAVTIAAAKNLPGVLEITLLNRLNIDPGARYAVSTFCRYLITAVGVVVSFKAIGFRWSQVQWLVAALSVGLGFGLQEVVANFICGLIILFERPFRVGDVVTVGETSGTVTRIRIRATTITDWDRHELIVPNKEFITGKLINWSLSDPLERIVIPMRLSHGSDTALAEELLLQVAKENPLVLEEPAPWVLFMGFDENGLNFELRVFVTGVGNRLPAMHQLHQAIDHAFREAGIKIALPQRDTHLDASSPIPVRVES